MRNNITCELLKSNNIVLLCHINPDGDSVGSTLGLYHALKGLGKNVDVVISDVPERFAFIEGYNDIKNSSDKKYDLGVILDTATTSRINNPDNILDNVSKIMVIDHHINNSEYGDINYVEERSSCCEIVYDLLKEMNILIDNLIATPLTVGLLTDTGGLSHPDVTSSSYEMASEVSKIIEVPSIYKKVLDTITKKQFELNKIAVDNLEFYKDGKITFTYVTIEDINRIGASLSDCDFLANTGRNIEGVIVSIFARIYEEEIRVSLRSNGVSINEVAMIFGGGGHRFASGIVTNMDFELLKKSLIDEVGKKIDEWYISGK